MAGKPQTVNQPENTTLLSFSVCVVVLILATVIAVLSVQPMPFAILKVVTIFICLFLGAGLVTAVIIHYMVDRRDSHRGASS